MNYGVRIYYRSGVVRYYGPYDQSKVPKHPTRNEVRRVIIKEPDRPSL